ncbi:family 43 glycosylhydrolase [Pseudarthrobacter sp. J64]|uniref:glycoside hydrolase family 43 protein n=1 Tax=Pseudarthrobacter sp. J64 TaxID=3116485 RepID=UPI002E81378D|nr:family 43 glycosylhydrolase [Pseudarthrobacter sp. J64]MEE2568935.1 family 43 glycosylhydrolase [Pseudarthrobacter sp. J64]
MTSRNVPVYANPILNADWPDPDAVQVRGVYYLIASSFNRVPGLPVLKSRNLVDWEHAGHALLQLPPTSHYSLVRHGGGVWAPALRYHDGRFWIFYPDPDHGIFVLTAEQAEGPWSAPHLLYAGRGLIDPCPLWDDDGEAYLVHGWAKSRIGVKNRLTVHRMSPDASRLLDHGTHVINGDELPGYSTLEGPKFYKRDGWYWIFAPAGGVATGWQSVFRSRSPFGPYEERRVLVQGDTDVNGPHQGAWVTTPQGEDWFLHFQDRGPYGRVVHLQPMGWDEDGWPWMGERNHDGGPGTPVITHPYPAGTVADQAAPPASDDFMTPRLGPQWHWQANPLDGWAHQCGGGHLVLKPKANDPINLRELPNVLGQILPGTPSTFTTTLELQDVPVGTRAGVVVLGLEYAWLGIIRTADGYVLGDGTGGDGPQERQHGRQRQLPGSRIELQIRTDGTPRSTFAWRSGPGEPWEVQGWNFEVVKGQWIGAELGIFATSPLGSEESGNVIVGPVRVETATARRANAPQLAAAP